MRLAIVTGGVVEPLRLCLVRVKAFPENIPFSGNAIFRKGKCFYVFGCISKNFPKNIFWCLEMLQGKDKPISTRTKPRLTLNARDLAAPENTSRSRWTNPSRPRRRSRDREAPRRFAGSRSARTRDRDRRRDLAKRRSRSRKHRADHDQREGKIAISDRDRRRWCL